MFKLSARQVIEGETPKAFWKRARQRGQEAASKAFQTWALRHGFDFDGNYYIKDYKPPQRHAQDDPHVQLVMINRNGVSADVVLFVVDSDGRGSNCNFVSCALQGYQFKAHLDLPGVNLKLLTAMDREYARRASCYRLSYDTLCERSANVFAGMFKFPCIKPSDVQS